jgi:hypothetical protein
MSDANNHEKNDFEVIESEEESSSDEESTSPPPFSQDDRSFILDLYKENRDLLKQITEKEKLITKLKERNVYLANSNIFWLCCYFGTVMSGFLSFSIR